MKNVTLAIEEKVLREARRYAAENDTTLNALVREFSCRPGCSTKSGVRGSAPLGGTQ